MEHIAHPSASQLARKVRQHLFDHRDTARAAHGPALAALPDERVIERLVDVAFWTSLRREELSPPRISLSFVAPEAAEPCLRFAELLPLRPSVLSKIAPGVQGHGVHLGVWEIDGELAIWGATRNLPVLCLAVEMVAPGHLVVKHRHSEGAAKFTNIAVLEGQEIKVVSRKFPGANSCTSVLEAFLGLNTEEPSVAANTILRLAVSMRDHRHGGSLLVVPQASNEWRSSIHQPVPYRIDPAYTELADLVRDTPDDRSRRRWRDALTHAIDAVAGLTAVDGATIITDAYEVLAFGAKIIRPDGSAHVHEVAFVEPLEESEPRMVPVGRLGGTRHISGAQFAFIHRDAMTLVASQDGPFTIFAWSQCDDMLYAYRIDSMLL